ncbi:ER membrane protein complex subunit 10 [Belonocnema kinseyi]|uniref:ER membrane protein complex subunit 10 n=1 Tax=Belonocnema kinseyi TaxID=2817044 RepID=UPI00143CD7DC|nr:ER membrane protein complex subunit 10 [Belonocnema kinseyi]
MYMLFYVAISMFTLPTFVRGCHLLGTDLEDSLYVWLDSTAEPVAISLAAHGPCHMEGPSTKMWTTNVQVKYPDGGPMPDTATYILKLEKEREARERGDVKDNRSFLAKYWMFIVPGFILFVMLSAQNPEGGPPGGGGTGR